MRFIKKLVPQKLKNIYHLAQAVLANFLYGFPSKSIKIVGVTGTNGKTTTVQMIARILEEANAKVAVISTINFKIGDKEWVNRTKFTTLSSFAVQKFILSAVKARCEYLILEVSSHSLDQHRTWGINFDTAVITNVTREHLDYHKTTEEYRKAKLKLFKKARVTVVNLDMEKPEEFLQFSNKEKYGYTTQVQSSHAYRQAGKFKVQSGNLKLKVICAENIESEVNYTRYQIQSTKFQLNLPGLFNVENALAAICVGLVYGIDMQKIAQALEKIKGIPGRLEYVPNDKGLNVIIDYAVTPDSLEKLYKLISQIKEVRPLSTETTQTRLPARQGGRTSINSRIISVFGACGERDRGKRPIMGEIVSRYADFIILTNEDPYGESSQQIIEEISAGVKNKRLNENFWKILDRREAIKKALRIAKPGDLVVVTGKGAEETMAIGDERIPWNDKKVIQEILQELL